MTTGVADALVVFGITGDLARRSTLPALYSLAQQGLLTCAVIGVGRRPVSDAELRAHATESIQAAEEEMLMKWSLEAPGSASGTSR